MFRGLAILGALLAISSACASGTNMVDEDVLHKEFQLVKGGTTSIAELQIVQNRPVVVNLWATWCGPCLAEMPDFQTFHQENDSQILILGINISDSPTRSDQRALQLGITYLLGRDPDGTFTKALGAVGLPVTAFVDQSGHLAHVHHGPLDLKLLQDLTTRYLAPRTRLSVTTSS